MAQYGERYEGNGDGYNGYAADSPQAKGNGFENSVDPRSKYDFHEHERTSSRRKDSDIERVREKTREHSKDRERPREREKNRELVRDRDLDRYHREHKDRSEKRERGRDRSDDRDRLHSRDYDRHKDYERDRDGHRRHQLRSLSKSRSTRRSRSRSLSTSKRISGFDITPPAASLLPDATAAETQFLYTGQLSGATPVIPGIFPNMFPLAAGQIPTFPMMPVQAMTQQATRHARRVYVGGLPPSANEQSVAIFFSQVMFAIGGNTAGPGDAVVNVYINHEKKFAFVEMRSVEEASNAMALDGIIFEGGPVKVRRPSDYNPSLAAALGPSQPNPNLNLAAVGLTPGSAGGLEGPDRIFVGGLPYYFTEVQVRELLESFGPLRGFDLVKDRETGNSKGYAFCVYQDLSVTDIACAALNGIKMGDKTLTVRRANQGTVQPRPEHESVLLQAQQQVALQKLVYQVGSLPTKVICLTHVLAPDELGNDDEYEYIMEDMRVEGGKYGKLVNVVIPRPGQNGEPTPGVGKVFLEYEDVDGSAKARQGLHGRKFGENQVAAVFYSENKFAEGNYDD
ncbi:splicing factor U2af large subunit A-like isoform X1 [Zingiber officinale]|uniref:splicing factor U2af large subunit A-like isoform X1 n=1 Tax=Zingiber officinale TaxID=94328 RepID=UPI001C4C5527|nr:splicing factor U2af large subunit A-like isoform X1 [Zingiber officinale]